MKSRFVPVLFLDLDGTVRKGPGQLDGRFVNDPEDVEIIPEALEQMRWFRSHGWRIVGVTNQGGVAYGFMSMETMIATMQRTSELCLDEKGAGLFDLIMACPHHEQGSVKRYAYPCLCRKPLSGMIHSGIAALEVLYPDEIPRRDLMLMVGDRPEDSGLAENVGIKFISAETWWHYNPSSVVN